MFTKILKPLDDFLNGITMYRLVFYCLLGLIILGAIFCFTGLLHFNGWSFLLSVAFLTLICWLTNTVLAKFFHAPTNLESVYISAFILSLIINPARNIWDFGFLFWVAVLTIASKYVIALHKKHLFNPVALGVYLTSFLGIGVASWWIGQSVMLPFVVVVAILVIRKVNRTDLTFGFMLAALCTILALNHLRGFESWPTLLKTVQDSPWLFFTAIMLTEPLTTPPSKFKRLIYGVVVGILFAPQLHIGGWSSTPETALLLGNVFAYLVSPKSKWMLTLKEKVQIAPQMWDYIFTPDSPVKFQPGQYLELTLPQDKPDSRGSRRYLTIASSPTETDLRFGIKFYEHGSSFKKQLLDMPIGASLLAGQLGGDFLMPKDPKQKLVFIAGGIGVTPYRSMIKFVQDMHINRDIILLYSNNNESEAVYQDVFSNSVRALYIYTGKQGHINKEYIQNDIPDYLERTFYISGSHGFVVSLEQELLNSGILRRNIITDFFPGFA